MEDFYWYLILSIYLFLNISVSVFLFKRDDLDNFQKCAQTFFTWLIPIIGALIFWQINRSHDAQYKEAKAFGGGAHKTGSYDSAGDGGSGD
ncbi:hypothetical protein [Alteromonas sp. W364]|uniref:hypothetical protein n=1 Tax=Alteromonas sp. W364 TaxID=3075610 RepID=UPI002883664D|nr:hypothetical protein [Alteromonas sp. W364]MDT0629872.1 hypothetical protein [Alteromonas sp. W364]